MNMAGGWFALMLLLALRSLGATGTLWDSTRWAEEPAGVNCGKTNWVHIPKTSSTFCLNLQHVCCKDRFEQLTSNVTTGHLESLGKAVTRPNAPMHYTTQYCFTFERAGYEPLKCVFAGRPEHLPVSKDFAEQQSIVIIREPRSRLISAFLDAVHVEGMRDSKLFRDHINNITREGSPEALLKGMETYAAHSDTMGCQTKMLIGQHCAGPFQLTQASVEEAAERLSRFYFVGVFEQYARSLRLFHAMAGAHTEPSDVELFPVRTANEHRKAYLHQHFQYSDPWDSALHARAQQIFEEELSYVNQKYATHI